MKTKKILLNVCPYVNNEMVILRNTELIFEVKTDSYEYPWNIKNKSRKNISSGVYIYIVSNNNGEKKIGKIAIIR